MKKGFTLVELLATVILLGALIIIAYPKIIDMAEKKQKEVEKNKLELIYNAADTYIESNANKFPKTIGAKYCFSIEKLEKENLVPVDINEYSEKFLSVKIGKNNSYVIMNEKCPDDKAPLISSFTVTSKTYNPTTNRSTITVSVVADGNGSPISKYEFSIYGGDYVESGLSTYTFSNLSGSSFTLRARVTNELGIEPTYSEEIIEPIYMNVTPSTKHFNWFPSGVYAWGGSVDMYFNPGTYVTVASKSKYKMSDYKKIHFAVIPWVSTNGATTIKAGIATTATGSSFREKSGSTTGSNYPVPYTTKKITIDVSDITDERLLKYYVTTTSTVKGNFSLPYIRLEYNIVNKQP